MGVFLHEGAGRVEGFLGTSALRLASLPRLLRLVVSCPVLSPLSRHSLLAEASAQGLAVGIYTSESQWGPITNNSPIGSSYPLWYAHYDGNPSYSDFSPFAGWSSPSIKQFAGTTSVCGASVDQNWYP